MRAEVLPARGWLEQTLHPFAASGHNHLAAKPRDYHRADLLCCSAEAEFRRSLSQAYQFRSSAFIP
jgi:hypothetical protein